jgi:hypothetical protein
MSKAKGRPKSNARTDEQRAKRRIMDEIRDALSEGHPQKADRLRQSAIEQDLWVEGRRGQTNFDKEIDDALKRTLISRPSETPTDSHGVMTLSGQKPTTSKVQFPPPKRTPPGHPVNLPQTMNIPHHFLDMFKEQREQASYMSDMSDMSDFDEDENDPSPTPVRRATRANPVRRPSRTPFRRSGFMDGSPLADRPLQGSNAGLPETYIDHLSTESHVSQSAHDKEQHKGVNARELTASDLRTMEQMEEDERASDRLRATNMVEEVEILTGGSNDSLMDGGDLQKNEEQQKYDGDGNDNPLGYSTSGLDRGRQARPITEIDLESIEQSLDDLFSVDNDRGEFDGNISSIGRRFGAGVPSVRDVATDDGGSIMSSISGLSDLASQDGSWFSKDKDLDKDVDINERMAGANKVPMNKDFQIGKYNANMNAGNKLLMSQGASLGTISDMRKKDVDWKQPNRTTKNNQVGLVRMGNRTALVQNQEFDP